MTIEEIAILKELLEDLSNVKFTHIKEKAQQAKEMMMPVLEKWEEKREQEEKERPGTSVKKDKPEDKYTSKNGYNPVKALRYMVSGLSMSYAALKEMETEQTANEKKTQDILHFLELNDPTETEMLNYAKKLKTIRMERRNAKDFVDFAKMITEIHDRYPKLIIDLKNVERRMNELVATKEGRTYKPKEMTVLEAAFQKAQHQPKKEVIK